MSEVRVRVMPPDSVTFPAVKQTVIVLADKLHVFVGVLVTH